MACQDNYITLNQDTPSRSGQYASDLPGVEDLVLELTSKNSESAQESWERVYRNAWTNMVSDVQFALQQKFFVNFKLVSRVTSEFKTDLNGNSGLAGVKIQFDLPRYGRLHIVDVKVRSNEDYPSPGLTLDFYDEDENGELLHSVSESITEGHNTIEVDRDFETDKLFIAYDASSFSLFGTDNKYYAGGLLKWDKLFCMWPCFGGTGSVRQVNGGGLNVTYNVYCSAEKFVCENINLFKKTFWWKIGQELAVERRIGNRLNQFTTMTDERKTELADFYQAQYSKALDNSIEAHNVDEDPYCFQCKGTVNVKTNLP